MYANIAVDAPIDNQFDYHVPPELENVIEVGHLVQVPFGTSMQHGIVLSLHEESPIEKTKPIYGLLDPRPALTTTQIDIARWMSRFTLAPIGLCLWLWFPPGLTGHTDIQVDLLDEHAEMNGKPAVESELERQIIELLKRRGSLKGWQFNQALAGKQWRNAVDGLARHGVVRKQPILSPPRVRPKIIQTAALDIHPNDIERETRARMATKSKAADLLEVVAADHPIDAKTPLKAALKAANANKNHAETLISEGLLIRADDDMLTLGIPAADLVGWLDVLRKVEKYLRILNVLARESDALDVSWLYAQADCDLNDLKRLEEAGLIVLGEKQTWRDSLAERSFVAKIPPMLTDEQKLAWGVIKDALDKTSAHQTAQPPSRKIRKGTQNPHFPQTYRAWSMPVELYRKLSTITKELRLAPTAAENQLWKYLRAKQLNGYLFRRQHAIERFIVAFYCRELRLVIEVDGGIQQYTEQDAATRQAVLENLSLRVIRLSETIVLHETNQALTQISAIAEQQKTQLAQKSALTPLPEFGEGQLNQPDSAKTSTTFLLHGVTGSGKTELYLRAIERTLALGRSALFLVPEIALTPQTVRRVAARFPGKVAVVHSGLSEGERYDTWRRSRDGLIQVIVGARSALFTPLPNIGLIILDEAHDGSYKQSPPVPPPYYHARQAAEEIIKQHGGVLILGTATPDMETAYRAARGEIRKIELARRIIGHRVSIHELAEKAGVMPRYQPATHADDAVTMDLPPVHVVDMREELKSGNTSIFSYPLQNVLADVLERREQAILFLNRRGQATYVFCRDCGYVASCPRCDTPLTHHRTGEVLTCHRCGFTQPEPTQCPACQSKRIKFFGAGTQQVEEALIDMFPRARVARWDADTAKSPEAHEAIMQRFIDRKTDVMIGTQMVAKGLDLPLVTLVGVISADVGLNLPDFRAGERTFQLLTQVAGRAGRGLLGGEVILQTYRPEHYAIQAASKHDFKAFYAKEIAYRREMGYPPFRRMIRILFRFPTEMQARAEAERAANLIRHRLKTLNMTGTELIGPAPCFFLRENKLFRWHVLLRGPDPTAALEGLTLPRGWYVDVDPVDIL